MVLLTDGLNQVQQVKGKQVRILYELVTVIRKCRSACIDTVTERLPYKSDNGSIDARSFLLFGKTDLREAWEL